jgi:hypothetical protein
MYLPWRSISRSICIALSSCCGVTLGSPNLQAPSLLTLSHASAYHLEVILFGQILVELDKSNLPLNQHSAQLCSERIVQLFLSRSHPQHPETI